MAYKLDLCGMTFDFCQEADTAGGNGEIQSLRVELIAQGVMNEEGYYWVIKTDRWAVDDPQELWAIFSKCKAAAEAAGAAKQ